MKKFVSFLFAFVFFLLSKQAENTKEKEEQITSTKGGDAAEATPKKPTENPEVAPTPPAREVKPEGNDKPNSEAQKPQESG